MLTATARASTVPVRFLVRGLAVSLGLFGLLRLPWTEAHILLPYAHLQGALALGLFGTPALPIEATLACSGADTLAICLAAVLAYPVPWRARLAGAAGGFAVIFGLNTLRIGTLGAAVARPSWFTALHLYVWPTVLTLALAGYVFAWIHVADRRRSSSAAAIAPPALPRWRRFILLAIGFLLVFTAAGPFYLDSPVVLVLAGVVARAAAVTLGVVGINAHAAANVLWAPRGVFLVTQECISTPLIPIYLAAVCAYSTTRRRLVAGLVATLPLFLALGVARLLVVALPGVVSPTFFVHAFYQLLAGAVIVCIAAWWRHGRRTALGYALLGIAVGVLFMQVLGPALTRAVAYPTGLPLDDPQGAIAFLPAFQVGFYLAVWVAAFLDAGSRRVLAGLAGLVVSQIAGLLVLHALTVHAGLTLAAHVRDVRGWALVGPLMMLAAVVNLGRARR